MTSTLQAATVAALLLGTGAATVSAMKTDIPDYAVPDGPWQAGGALDGVVFHTVDTVRETGEVMRDELHFAAGGFLSAMCQDYCDFGWSDYRTWTDGAVIRFTATTRCPDAPHTVVWYGTVDGDALRFEATWTTRRWYWTRQINIVGEGVASGPAADPAG